MWDPRQSHRSAFRNLRAEAPPMTAPSVSSPAGAQDSTTVQARGDSIEEQVRRFLSSAMQSRVGAQGQGQALRQPSAWNQIPDAAQAQLQGGYSQGGFEGVRAAVGPSDWYNIPSHVRTQLLAGVSGSGG